MTTGELVARPFPKFFSLGQSYITENGEVKVAAPVTNAPFVVTEKIDGSLGIYFRDPITGKGRIATRGSFSSAQAQAGQRLWDEKYAPREHTIPTQLTLLMEIVSPDTRVVVPYDFEDLVLIGAVDRFSGRELTYEDLQDLGKMLQIPVTQRLFEGNDIITIVSNVKDWTAKSEGVVIAFWLSGGSVLRLKVKTDEYQRMHTLMINLNDSAIVDLWAHDELVDLQLPAGLPDYFRTRVSQLVSSLDTALHDLVGSVENLYVSRPNGDKRVFARWVDQLCRDGLIVPKMKSLFFHRWDLEQHGVSAVVDDAIRSAMLTGAIMEDLTPEEKSLISDCSAILLGLLEPACENILCPITVVLNNDRIFVSSSILGKNYVIASLSRMLNDLIMNAHDTDAKNTKHISQMLVDLLESDVCTVDSAWISPQQWSRWRTLREEHTAYSRLLYRWLHDVLPMPMGKHILTTYENGRRSGKLSDLLNMLSIEFLWLMVQSNELAQHVQASGIDCLAEISPLLGEVRGVLNSLKNRTVNAVIRTSPIRTLMPMNNQKPAEGMPPLKGAARMAMQRLVAPYQEYLLTEYNPPQPIKNATVDLFP
jgi:RNA ligase